MNAEYLIPVSPSRSVYMNAAFPLNEDEWRNFMRCLDAMRPGLVRSDEINAPLAEGVEPDGSS